MHYPRRIHVLGASGSGTTSLAAVIAGKHGHLHLDTDDFYWAPTDPPYRKPRPPDERLELLRQALSRSPSWVLSGSLCGWGDSLIPQFDLVVLLVVPTAIRLKRLRSREIALSGKEAPAAFLEWAGAYDTGGLDMRSRARHEAWLSGVQCRVTRLEGDRPVAEQLASIDAR